jgi:heptaprenyl diphosphate synthase
MVEGLIPIPVPGVKLGLANIIILVMLYDFKTSEAFMVLIIRIFLVGLLRGNIFQVPFFMSLCGGLCSFIIMRIFSLIKFFSIIGVSVIGSIFHCVGQIVIAIILLGTAQVVFYLPLIAILSTVTGVLTGIISKRFLSLNLTEKYNLK